MFSPVLRWSAAALLVLPLSIAAANAAPVPYNLNLNPNNPLNANSQYDGFQFQVTTSGSVTYQFDYEGPAGLTAANSTTNLSVNSSGFKTLQVAWFKPNDANPIFDISALGDVPANTVQSKDLPLSGLGIYKLVITWTVTDSHVGNFQTEVLTPPLQRAPDVPLPPALILFGSALVGLTVLGRRKRQGATTQDADLL